MFEDIFDIVAADFMPKPAAETYRRFFDTHDVDPRRAAMFEDIARNLAVPHASGMVTTLVVPRRGAIDPREAWAHADSSAPHVDCVTDDLTGFLQSIGRQVPK